MGYPGTYARSRPDHPAVILAGSGQIQTYRELDERSNQLTHMLRSQGLKRGDHIALLMENQIHYMEIVWAALRSGLHLTAINSHLTAPEATYIIDDCDARVVISSRALSHVAAALDAAGTPSVERWLMVDGVETTEGGPGWESYEEAVQSRPTSPVSDESTGGLMLYSSGTTGRPKGVKRPLPLDPADRIPDRMATFTFPRFSYSADMVYLSPAPMYHTAPLVFSIAVHRVGGTLVIMEKFDARALLADIARFSVTHTQLVPTMFVRMLKLDDKERLAHDLSSLEVAVHGAAPCPVDVKRRMIEWWGPILLEFYAGTEGNGTTFIDSETWLRKPGSVGQVQGGAVHICDADGNDVPPGEIGGVYFSGGTDFEYHKAPEKTADARLAGGRTTLGDVGYVDEDGFLFLTDRKAHMIISGGVNIYPQEVEDVLISHPAVADVAVIGVPHEEMGEQVKAVVELADGVEASDQISTELIAYCRERLATFKCPRSVDFEAQLPRLPTGKLYKRILRDRYWNTVGDRVE